MPVARRARRARRPRLAATLLATAASLGCLLSGPAHAGTPGRAGTPAGTRAGTLADTGAPTPT